jgi:hypothetical protein
MTPFEQAILLLASVQTALANGVRHYHPDGHLLETDKAILHAMVSGAKVRLDESDRVDRIDVETVFESLKQRTPRN